MNRQDIAVKSLSPSQHLRIASCRTVRTRRESALSTELYRSLFVWNMNPAYNLGRGGNKWTEDTHIFHLFRDFRVLRGPSQGRKFPVVNIVPPSAYPATECLAAERCIAVPIPPSGERESPECALDQRQDHLNTCQICSVVAMYPLGYGRNE